MRVYLDTMIWVYAYENDPVFGSSARAFMDNLRAGRHRLISSNFVLSELLVLPTRRTDLFTIARYRQLFSSPFLEIAPYNSAAVQVYADLRATHRTKPLDALHLATASAAQVDLFITADRALHILNVPGIGTITDLTQSIP